VINLSKATKIERISFSKLREATELPGFLDIQLDSFQNFLQLEKDPEERENRGLQGIFKEVFPVTDVHEKYSLEFVKYTVGRPGYSLQECRERNMTYGAPLKATLRLVIRGSEEKEKEVKEIIEQDVFLGGLPLMTPTGTFIVNGAERVIVSQLHRSPGVFFDEEIHPNGKRLYSARIIPYRGSWMEFNLDVNDVMFVHIDTRKKLPVATFLRALGYSSDEQIIKLFYQVEDFQLSGKNLHKLLGKVCASPVVDPKTGEVILACGETITDSFLEQLKEIKISKIKIISSDLSHDPQVIINTLKKDSTKSQQEALSKIYTLLRPGEPPSVEMAKGLLDRLFFSSKRYDLGEVGRHRINERLGLDIPLGTTTLTNQDFLSIVNWP